ncbi:hypothetical protein [Leisingera caerulea]|uniref:hypothetical protein n=1 Tax=Leisingera caerulea TaxID=506591 RepID=UPI0021A78055|nr:hypothetical protein [Leisingera caerulea]
MLERKVHSVRTAARELGMDPRRLRKLLVDANLVRPAETGQDDQWELFDAKQAQPHLDKISTLVSAKDFQQALNMRPQASASRCSPANAALNPPVLCDWCAKVMFHLRRADTRRREPGSGSWRRPTSRLSMSVS